MESLFHFLEHLSVHAAKGMQSERLLSKQSCNKGQVQTFPFGSWERTGIQTKETPRALPEKTTRPRRAVADVGDSVNSGEGGGTPGKLILGGRGDHPHQSELIRGWGVSSRVRDGMNRDLLGRPKVHSGFPANCSKNPNEPFSQLNTWKQERTQWRGSRSERSSEEHFQRLHNNFCTIYFSIFF